MAPSGELDAERLGRVADAFGIRSVPNLRSPSEGPTGMMTERAILVLRQGSFTPISQ